MIRKGAQRALAQCLRRNSAAAQYSLSRHPSLSQPPPHLASLYEYANAPLNPSVKSATAAASTTSFKFNLRDHKDTESGVRIGAQLYGTAGEFVTIGVCIRAGNINERPVKLANGNMVSGLTHIVEKLAWKNMAGKSRESIQAEIDDMGAVVDCVVTKDFTIYAMTVARNNLERGISLLGEAVFQPELNEETLNEAIEDAHFEVTNAVDPTEQEIALTDAQHIASFSGNVYSNPKHADIEALEAAIFSTEDVKSYMKTHYTPDRMTLVCTGLDRDDGFADLVDSIMVEKSKTCTFSDGKSLEIVAEDIPVYQAGESYVFREFNTMQSVSQLPNNVHFSIGFPSPSFTNTKQWICVEVLRSMLGGGTTFSSGGPGKGMFARLYKDVLAHGFFWHCKGFHNFYKGSSLFGISASCEPHFLSLAVELVLQEFVKLRWTKISETELERAKNQLKTNTFLNLESKPQQYEDLTKQLMYGEKYITPQEWEKLVDEIEVKDVKLVIHEYFTHNKPSVAAVGDVSQMPTYEDIVNAIDINNTTTPGKLPETYRQKLMKYLQGMRSR